MSLPNNRIKKQSRKLIWILVVVTATAALLALGPLIFSFFSLCSNQIKSEIDSPDHLLKAVIFTRDCGATTSESTQVSVIAKDAALPNQSGNTFVEDSNYQAARTLSVDVKWINPRKLSISYDPKARVFLSQQNLEIQTGFFSHERVEVLYKTSN